MSDPNANANGNYSLNKFGPYQSVEMVYIEMQTAVNNLPGPEANRERPEDGDEQRTSGDLP